MVGPGDLDCREQRINCGYTVVAHAKLLVACSIASDASNVFNPQVLLEWERATGCIDSGFYNTNVEGIPIDCAASLQKELKSVTRRRLSGVTLLLITFLVFSVSFSSYPTFR